MNKIPASRIIATAVCLVAAPGLASATTPDGRLSPTLRYGLALNAVLETATDSLLSDKAFEFKLATGFAWYF